MKKKYLIGTAVAIGIMSLSAASVFAATQTTGNNMVGARQFSNLTQEERTAKMEEMHANHEKIEQAAINGDYEAWSKLIAEMPMGAERLKVITKDNFTEFSKAHKLMAESAAIFTKLGFERGGHMNGEFGKGMGRMGKCQGGNIQDNK